MNRNRMFLTKSLLAVALPLTLSTGAFAETRSDLQDSSDPGSLTTSDQSLMNRKDGMRADRDQKVADDARVAKGMERSEPRAMLDDSHRDANELLRNSGEAYRALAKGNQPVPASITSRAQCVAIFPNTITAAAVVGGSHGEGIASCKNGSAWSPPAFVEINAMSLGAQIGAKASDVVLYFTSPESVAALKRGKFAMGADASVVAGSFDRSFDTSNAGVVAYQRSSGAFLGLALNGGNLSTDEDANRAYYGRDVTTADVLENRVTTSMNNPLSSILPQS